MRFLWLVALSARPASALAADGNTILADMDTAMNTAKDLQLSYEIIDRQKGRDERKLAMDIAIKGDMRVTEFTHPADMKGTRVFIQSQTQMYIYLPAYKKVRRIASHVTNQGFMGTTYSNDDLALNRFANKYDAKLLGETDAVWTLELSKKNDEAPYPKAKIEVDKKLRQPIRLEFYSDEGKHIKTETRKGFACEGNVCAPGELTMVDHRDSDHSSTLVRKKWKVNPGLPDSVFSKRYLQRGS
jgi:outer membrane lipoprotein-sorting protein